MCIGLSVIPVLQTKRKLKLKQFKFFFAPLFHMMESLSLNMDHYIAANVIAEHTNWIRPSTPL